MPRASAPISSPRADFVYAAGTGPSGQRAASEDLMRVLRGAGWQCRSLTTPVFDRGAPRWRELPRYLLARLGAGLAAQSLRVGPKRWLHLNIGLTRNGLRREWPFLQAALAGPSRGQILLAIHGSLFLQYPPGGLEEKLLLAYARAAQRITVLGPEHRQWFIQRGLAAERVVEFPNTTPLPPLTAAAVAAKQQLGGPLRVLYLGALYSFKGFHHLVEAAPLLAALADGPALEITLCGPLPLFPGAPFASGEAARAWLAERLATLASGRVRVTWIPGAFGDAKVQLFHRAHVFVLPSIDEAQPLVLLEAMAAGCAIATTTPGQIAHLLPQGTALHLREATAPVVAEALAQLASNPAERSRLAAAAHARFLAHYSPKHFAHRSLALFGYRG